MTRRWPVAGLALAVLWLFVRGVSPDPVGVAEELLIGLAVGMPIAFATRRLYTPAVAVLGGVRTLPYAGLYLVLFLYELVTANVEVAYRVLAPSMPINPDVVEVPLRVQSDLAITTIANSITLTPGTLTMDYDADRNSLYVHSIGAEDRGSVVEPIRRWEDYALVIFDEDRDPGTPVPDLDPDHEYDADDRRDAADSRPADSPGSGRDRSGPEGDDGPAPDSGADAGPGADAAPGRESGAPDPDSNRGGDPDGRR